MESDYVTNKAVALIKQLHGTTMGAKEFSGGWSPERVDAILFSVESSFLIETKVTRSDFLADQLKQLRINPEEGVGRYRYYACPEGLIAPEELPDKWGLIYVVPNNRRSSMPVGYGGYIKTGTEKCPVKGCIVEKFKYFGTETPGNIKKLPEYYKRPEYPANRYSFDERCLHKERQFIYALAQRYKTRTFMENIL